MNTETVATETVAETHTFQAEVAQLLHLMVHAVYSETEVFLRELISNGSDACDKLRYEAIQNPDLMATGGALSIRITPDSASGTLTVTDTGIGMDRQELIDNLGTVARSGTRAFISRLGEAKDGTSLIGQFGVGFYAAFMVADRVDVISRRAGSEEAFRWSSDGKGTFSISAVPLPDAPTRGTRVLLHLMDDAGDYTQRYTLERIVKTQSGHVPVPISIVEKPGAEPTQIADGAALWTKPRSEISAADYTDFYRSVAGQLDEPRTLYLCHERTGFRDRTNTIFDTVQRNPGCVQWRRREEPGTVLELFVAQPLRLAQRFAQVDLHTERQSQRAAENTGGRLSEAGVGERSPGRMSDQDRGEVRRHLVVGLHVVAEVLEVSVR